MAEKKTTKKAPAAKQEAAMLTVRLKKSLIGRGEAQIATAQSLGLKRPGDTARQPDNGATRGKIAKICHLVEVL